MNSYPLNIIFMSGISFKLLQSIFKVYNSLFIRLIILKII